MDFIKKIIATLFSTQFLLKLLIIAGIVAVLRIAGDGIVVNHYVTSTYGGIDVTVKHKRGD